MNASHPSAAGDPAPPALRLAIVSSDRSLGETLGREFETTLCSPEEAVRVLGCDADVYLVDARTTDHVQLVAQLAQSGARPLVVLGRSKGAQAAMRYLDPDAGADDYLSCGVDAPECGARIRAAARRRAPRESTSPDELYVFGEVTISLARQEVRKNGKLVRLTPTEFRLLDVLVRHVNHVVPHQKLMGAVWGLERLSAKHYLRVYIRHLRQKLEADPDLPRLILNERGRGYQLRSQEQKIA